VGSSLLTMFFWGGILRATLQALMHRGSHLVGLDALLFPIFCDLFLQEIAAVLETVALVGHRGHIGSIQRRGGGNRSRSAWMPG
jgi:hypothetical protein